MSHLIKDFIEDKEYELGFNKTNDYLVLKSSNKLYKIYKNNTQILNTQQTSTDSIYLKENKDFEEIKTILKFTEEKEYQGVKVWVEVEKPYYIDSEGYLQGLGIIKNPCPKLTEKTSKFQSDPIAIVLHSTDSSTATSTLETWKRSTYGTHFLIDKDGTIYQCASLHKYTQHVGKIRSKAKETGNWSEKEKKYIVGLGWNPEALSNYEKTKSYPNRYPINSDSIGIEVVGKYDDKTKRYPNATKKQLESLEHLVIALLELLSIDKTDIYAHAKIAYKDTNMTEGVYLLEYLRDKL